ncbi:MAG: AmmeMemoRadiSam system radical SAM enzyme [Deltaproteobacteria bacterium]|nr:AmmeMemoRadiSam system radical SAM enzyme [Deltaproteobacteria bacterium]NIS77606.1 AmmeMemoRadiSam system radical SAM enzyme [Deltaproteobacteria bacterium]
MKISRRQFFTACGTCAASLIVPRPESLRRMAAATGDAIAFSLSSDLSDREAKYYERKQGLEIECLLCPRKCLVGDRERGYCGVRENRAGKYMTLIHSRPCTVHVDPIEKKPFFHVYPASRAFSMATAGCNVNCKFCQNWEISQSRPEQTRNYRLSPEDIVRRAKESGCMTIAYTYSEPVVFYEYMYDCAVAGNEAGVDSIVVTAGYIQEKPLKELLSKVLAVKVDLKAFEEEYYKKIVRGELKPVLDGLVSIASSGTWLEIVYLVVPTLNDDPDLLKKMAVWIEKELGAHVPLHLSRFYPQYLLRDLPPTPVSTLRRLREVCIDAGLKYVYVGNVPGDPGEHTYCPRCGKRVISRLVYFIGENHVQNGKCAHCGEKIEGIFEKKA